MIVEPKVRDFICTTAHPTGCDYNVKNQIEYIKSAGGFDGPKKVLIIGASTGYGLATRIAAAYGSNAATLGIMFEKPSKGTRTATPGWYNTKAFEDYATKDGLYAKSINGDAFSKEIKDQAIAMIKEELTQVDMVVYSLASPRRTTADGTTYKSVLKTTDKDFTNKSLNLKNNQVLEATIATADETEIASTIKVMGGEDWMDWITALREANVLAPSALTVAYSYIGPVLTYPVYYKGTIGMAKNHLYNTSLEIKAKYPDLKAYISINKALVTQASSAIPIVPLYMAVLYKVMKDTNIHEGCIEQMHRLFHEKLAGAKPITDEENRIRLDDLEMQEEIQAKVMEYWDQIDSSNVMELADIKGYWEDFYHMFGFQFDEIDYNLEVEI